MRTTADGLTRQLRNAGYHIHTFSVSSTGDYAVADADWNYKDVPHLNVVHTKVRCAVGTMDDELITTLAMQKVFGIELPIVIVNFVSSGTSQTYYTTLGPFALVVYTEYFELEPNKTKVVTTYNIAGSKLFKLLFPLLQRVLTGNYRTLMSEDLPMRDRRGELRARGFGYRTDGKPRTFPDTVDVNFLNLVVPPRTSTNTQAVKMDALGADGERVLVGESDDRGLCLVRQGDDVLLMPRFCSHEGANLDCASLKNGRLSCPWHGKLIAPLGKLAATEGSSWQSGAYSARIQGGEVVVGFPGGTVIAQQSKTYGTYICPSCGRDRDEAVLSVRSQTTAEESAYSDLREHWRGFFKEKAFFSYFRCGGCGMLYSPEYFTAAQLEELYASMAPNMDAVNEDALERTQLGYFKELRKWSGLTGGFLEIGPDVGMFTEYCARNGDFSKYWLCEPNVDVHDDLRRRLAGKDFSISTSLLDLAAIPDGSLSVVAMIHVLDHILDPLDFLRALRAKVGPNGIVLIVTHNERSLLAKGLKARWPAYCLQHPHLFNPESIAGMLGAAGFDTVKVNRSVNHFPVTFLAKHLAYALKLGEINLPAWPGLQVPLKLGNMITIATPAAAAPA